MLQLVGFSFGGSRCNFVINILVVPYTFIRVVRFAFDCKYIVCVLIYCCHSFVRCICFCVKFFGVSVAVKKVSANSNRCISIVSVLSKNISIYLYVC